MAKRFFSESERRYVTADHKTKVSCLKLNRDINIIILIWFPDYEVLPYKTDHHTDQRCSHLFGLISEEKITELKTDFRVRRIHYPCATVATPIDKQSLITKRVMPFMLKLVRDTAANCLNAVDSLLADGEWKSEPIQVGDSAFSLINYQSWWENEIAVKLGNIPK